MNEMIIFNNPEFGNIRMMDEDGSVLFCGNDVAKALGYKSPKDAISTHCRGAVKRRLTDSIGREQDTALKRESWHGSISSRSKRTGTVPKRS